jgi:hypothetical protein
MPAQFQSIIEDSYRKQVVIDGETCLLVCFVLNVLDIIFFPLKKVHISTVAHPNCTFTQNNYFCNRIFLTLLARKNIGNDNYG